MSLNMNFAMTVSRSFPDVKAECGHKEITNVNTINTNKINYCVCELNAEYKCNRR